jgi:peptide/nickel transport system ATP-binding protein
MDPLLEIKDLRVTYRGLLSDVDAVRGVSLQLNPGEALAIVGESGSGKTTVAMALLGLLNNKQAQVSGQVIFQGRNILQNSRGQWQDLRGNKIAMIFQDPMTSLNPYLSVGLQVAEPLLRHSGMSTEDARVRAVDLLTEMEVPEPEASFKRYPHQYSGGMRQRAMIASASSAHPVILVADEPTTALDVITQARVLKLMKNYLQHRNMALILITHDLGIVAGICHRVIVMKAGEVVETGTAGQIYHRPQQPYTKALLAAVPRVDSDAADAFGRSGATPKDPKTLIKVNKLSVHFSRSTGTFRKQHLTTKAVDGVDLDVHRGEVFGLVGQSGSGKSTLIRAIAGLQPATSGEIFVQGRMVDPRKKRDLRALRRRVQMIFQDPLASLNGRFTAERIIAEPLINFGIMNRRNALKRARELMELVNLDPNTATCFPHAFSGGQCQRIGIARAIAIEPEILLCDEPVSALDVSIQAEVLGLLMDLRQKLDLTLLFISHDLAVVRHLADRVAVMHQGQIVELKSADDIYTKAEHAYTKSLLAAVPIPDPRSNWLSRSV